jgi:hypothetical protein
VLWQEFCAANWDNGAIKPAAWVVLAHVGFHRLARVRDLSRFPALFRQRGF